MATEWPIVKIDEIQKEAKGAIAIGPFGSRMKSDCYTPSGIPVIRGTNITGGPSFEGDFVYISAELADSLGSCNVYLGDLVFPHRGSIGEVGIVSENDRYVISSSLMKLTCNQELADPWYVYYFFKSNVGKHELLKNASQVGTPGIGQPLTSLKSIDIPLPPLKDQKYIVHVLKTLDDKIELNRQINTTLESMAQALFKSWFVDFDPVIDNALAAGNPIPEPLQARADKRAGLHVWTSDEDARRASATEGASQKRAALLAATSAADTRSASATDNAHPTQTTPHTQSETTAPATPLQPLPSDLRALFPDSFVFNEEMGWVPEGWDVSTIGEQVDTTGGGTPSTKNPDFWEGGFNPFCTPKDMSQLSSWVLKCTERHLTPQGVGNISSGQLPAGTVLMSSRAPIGYLAISEMPVSVNQGIIAMLPSKIYSPMFLLNWASFNMDRVNDRANGSTFLEISKKNFRPIPFLVPNNQAINLFNEKAELLLAKIRLIADQISVLSGIRDELLPKLLSGQVQLPEAEQLAAEAL